MSLALSSAAQHNALNLIEKRFGISFATEPQPTQQEQALTYLAFKEQFWHQYIHTAFHGLIDDKLMQVKRYIETDGKEGIKKLMIFMPPRHGKSMTVSRMFPAWVLSELPDTRIITASYAQRLANKNSRFVRNLLQGSQYRQKYPHIRLDNSSQAVDEWDIEGREGGLIATGVGAGITGFGGGLIIIDDPIRSRIDAESELKRERIKDWYNDDLLTRLEEPHGAMILMHTRWHTDDLAGWLLNREPNEWEVVSLPAFATEDDALGRAVGEPLWKRYRNTYREQQEKNMYGFEALYQQQPQARGGGMFKTDNVPVVDRADVPELIRIVRFWDTAFRAKERNDATAGVKLGLGVDGRIYVLDVEHKRVDETELSEWIIGVIARDGRHVHQRFEEVNGVKNILQQIIRSDAVRSVGALVDMKRSTDEKYVRAQPFATQWNNGMVTIVRADWNDTYIDELKVFPNGKHDDQVDGSSGACDTLSEQPNTVQIEAAPDIIANYDGYGWG